MRRTNRQIAFLIVIFLSIFLVFFVGREFNETTQKRSFIITSNGINNFRKGLDISGWSRLVYQIDYSKYKEIYRDPAQLVAMKQNVEDIILKNIDRRISALWVSDYRSYIQQMNDEHYVIIEIGWVSDLDEAKEIIGRTVELEFKLPNEAPASAETIAERRQIAQNLYAQVKAMPDNFGLLTQNRWSDDILYNSFKDLSLSQLPSIYQNNQKLLDSMDIGSLSPAVLDGVYLDLWLDQTTWQPQSLEGFSFFRLIDRQIQDNATINEQTIIQTANAKNITYNLSVAADTDIKVGTYRYNPSTNTLSYAIKEIGADSYAYDARIVAIAKESMLGKEQADIAAEEARVAGLVTQVQNTIKGTLVNDDAVVEIYNDWIESDAIKEFIVWFTDTTEDIVTVQWLDTTYVIYNKSIKTPEEKLFNYLEVTGLSANDWTAFEQALKQTTIYTLEDVFIQNKQSWITAIDGQNRVLNGAYFKMASVGASQLGRPVVLIDFDDTGRDIFCTITEQIIGKQMAIFVWGQLITAPVIQDKICGGTAQIDGQFDGASARALAESLNEWALPAPLLIRQEEKISATLGETALQWALWAGLVGIILIIGLIWYMYGLRKAMVTLASLTMFLLALLALIKLIDYAMSLSAIAAIILSIGMGVDANILIYERTREELKDGKTIWSAIDSAYDRSRSAIRDGNLSTGLIALLLFTLGINIFKGFGSMMIINILLILFLATPLIKELLHIAFHRKTVFLKEWHKQLEVE
jgi:protein-export membrane protein SecD